MSGRMTIPAPTDVTIVEDDEAIRDALRFVLGVAGFEVTAYASAQAFLEHGRASPTCLIFDHHMPGMTGIELAAHLRKDGIKTPVLLVTGGLSTAIVARAAEMGLRVIEKPLAMDEVINFVTACGQSGAAA